jgi:pyrimidine-nucleoside phosphorylase
MSGAPLNVVALIERKKRGESLTADELRRLAQGFVAGEVPDYQMAAWLMAVRWRGMSEVETLEFTRALVATGREMDWTHLPHPAVDKHSTGGVGDKTSLVLVPLMAAAGLPFVKMSGRGLGHTGGTLDKLEAIAGFHVNLSPEALRAQVEAIGCALVGQSPDLVPADGLIYALRDVTGTVDSLPLMAASIMSKKLAGGARVIVLDVKYGSGALLPEVEEARRLAHAMVAIGEGAGRRVRAVLSPMHQPLGRAVGNALEIREVLETLHGEGPDDLWDLTLELGAQLLEMSGEARDAEEARRRLTELRDAGAGREKLRELIRAQGGDPAVVDDPDRLPRAPRTVAFAAERDGWVAAADARTIGLAALELGAGRRTKTDALDLSVGVLLQRRIGDRVRAGEPLAELHVADDTSASRALAMLRDAYRLADEPVPEPERGYEVIGDR